MWTPALSLLAICYAFCAVRAGKVLPDQWVEDVPQATAGSSAPTAEDKFIDFRDGDDPTVRAHWALLVAGSAGWGNYRHQADVFHAYQVLLAGGYSADHIVVMAYDDIAHYPDNPMPGRVFNRPGGVDVYNGVRMDYKGADVTAETFLAVLEGDASQVVNKGSGRVIASGPNDKVFLFYSDHGAAGVVGMPSGPFLYADQLMKTLRKKFHQRGFREMVMYIEACESGSMFEGLLDDNMAVYVTTAANSFESSWATYCPDIFFSPDADSLVPSNSIQPSDLKQSASSRTVEVPHTLQPSSFKGWWKLLQEFYNYLQHLLHRESGVYQLKPRSGQSSSAVTASSQGPYQPPQFTTCLGDLYSVAWMEDAEVSDLTKETLLQQYKKIKMRTSQNFTYEQGSHVMQYGALDIDHELAGDYEGMHHNGSIPPSPMPSADWLEFAAKQQQLMKTQKSRRVLLASPVTTQKQHIESPDKGSMLRHKQHKKAVMQHDADLLPLLHTAKHSHCPRKRAAATKALKQVTSHRQAVDQTAKAAVQQLLKHPEVGYVLMAQLAGDTTANLVKAHSAAGFSQHNYGDISKQHTSAAVTKLDAKMLMDNNGVNSNDGVFNSMVSLYADDLLGYLPGREGQSLVDDWDCLRSMVKAWEGKCGQLDQYGMRHTRTFANLCNAQVEPEALSGVLTNLCAAK